MKEIIVGDKIFKVRIAKTEEEKTKGLMEIKELPEDEGMLFVYDKPQTLNYWMKGTLIPLDIVFIDANEDVIKVVEGKPKSEDYITCNNAQYVLEVNVNSGIEKGDDCELDLDDSDNKEYTMKVLAPDGSAQMDLKGGERIISRRETIVVLRKAKKAYKTKSDSAYKSLGKYIFKVFKGQDNRDPEYVDSPKEDNKTK